MIIDEAEEEPAIDLKKLSMAGNSDLKKFMMRLALKKAMAAKRQEPAPVEIEHATVPFRRVCRTTAVSSKFDLHAVGTPRAPSGVGVPARSRRQAVWLRCRSMGGGDRGAARVRASL